MKKILVFVLLLAGLIGGVFYLSEKELAERTGPQMQAPVPVPEEEAGLMYGPPAPPPMYGPPAPQGLLAPYREPPAPVKDIDMGAGAALEQKFEEALNALLQDVGKAFNEYAQERAIMTAMIEDENLRDPVLVEKNGALMPQMATKMRAKAVDILKIFEEADGRADALLADVPAERQKVLKEKWDALVAEHAGKYQSFFENEQSTTKAYANLMRFYYSKRGSYSYDKEKDEIVFKTDMDKEFARKLRVQVNRWARAQDMVMRGL